MKVKELVALLRETNQELDVLVEQEDGEAAATGMVGWPAPYKHAVETTAVIIVTDRTTNAVGQPTPLVAEAQKLVRAAIRPVMSDER